MRYMIVTDDFEKTRELQNLLACDMFEFSDDLDYSNTEFIIFIYKISKGRCNSYVYDACASINNKKVALIGYGGFGFDLNRLLLKRLKKRSNLVVYSKYEKEHNNNLIYNDIINKKVITDGMDYSEVLTGSLCRLLLKKEI